MGAGPGRGGGWSHEPTLAWHLAAGPDRAGLGRFLGELGRLYGSSACFWRSDPDDSGFRWLYGSALDNSIVSFVRRSEAEYLVVVCNLTPQPREGYRVGVPAAGAFEVVLCSDDARFGGSGYPQPKRLIADPHPYHGFEHSVLVTLPPLSISILAPRDPSTPRGA